MKELALKMIDKIKNKIEFQKRYPRNFIGPIREI